MDFRIYSLEELGEIEKDMMGYIAPNGRFWSLGQVGRNPFASYAKSSFDGMEKIANAMVQELLSDNMVKRYLKQKHILFSLKDLGEPNNSHLPDFWPADKVLLYLGYCRFYRGYYDRDETYVELSRYDKANEVQLFVMNYLFALNSVYASTDMENERAILMKRLTQK